VSTENHRWVLSGGLASGKSKVREFLASLGVVTIDADAVGHEVLEQDGPAFDAVSSRWPQVVRDGEVERRALAEIVFNDPDELVALEGITHPHIFDTIRARVEGLNAVVVVEVPLLSHGLGDEWRRVIVDCRDDVRLERAIQRGMTDEDARARMAAQPSRQEWLAVADLVVPNHGSLDELERAVAVLSRVI